MPKLWSPLTPEQCEERLRAAIDGVLTLVPKHVVWGTVSAGRCALSIRAEGVQTTEYSVLDGRFEPCEGGTRIAVRFRANRGTSATNVYMIIFMSFFCIITWVHTGRAMSEGAYAAAVGYFLIGPAACAAVAGIGRVLRAMGRADEPRLLAFFQETLSARPAHGSKPG